MSDRGEKETHDQVLYKLLDGALMLVPKQSTTWKLQSRVETEQNVLERTMASRKVIHNRAKPVAGQ